MITYILFIIGFFFLIKGADLLIEGASTLAKRYNISDLAIGLTIVAFGTSAPELVVNVIASYHGNAELAIANILGSNIANTFVGIGIAAIICPLIVKKSTIRFEIPMCIFAAILIGFMANDFFLHPEQQGSITRVDGIILLVCFFAFFYYTSFIAKDKNAPVQETTKPLSIPIAILYMILGITGLSFGGDWIVNGAVKTAQALGMSQALIGMTIVAIGTSLPEFVTCAVSAYKGKNDIAIGNVVGSNLFNIFWVLGISSSIRPLVFDSKINLDVMVHIIATLLLFLLLVVANRKHVFKRSFGVLFILLYAAYIVGAVVRG